jgi:excisionase family DNA binding protein
VNARSQPRNLVQEKPAVLSVPSPSEPPQPPGPEERLAYSVDEAARLTGLSRDLLYDEMRRGHLTYLKVGRRRIITRQHLEQFLEIIPPQPPSKPTPSTRLANGPRTSPNGQ